MLRQLPLECREQVFTQLGIGTWQLETHVAAAEDEAGLALVEAHRATEAAAVGIRIGGNGTAEQHLDRANRPARQLMDGVAGHGRRCVIDMC